MSANNSFAGYGRLTRDPDVKVYNTKSGEQGKLANFTLAIDVYKDEVLFLNCKVYGKQAEIVEKYTHKGSRLCVGGTIRMDKYKDKDGNDRTSIYCRVDDVRLVDTKAESAVSGGENSNTKSNNAVPATSQPNVVADDMFEDDDDLPF